MANIKNKLTLVVLGRSGSGKGTQAKFILRHLKKGGVLHAETGRYLRRLLKKENHTTNILRKAISRGELAPSWLAAHLWLGKLVEGGRSDGHIVFDGAPRRIWEAKLMDEVMSWHQRSLPLCIYTDVTRKEGIRRLLVRGRKDDKLSAIKNRMKFFERNVVEVINYYKKNGRMLHINGNPSREFVREEINAALAKKFGKRWRR